MPEDYDNSSSSSSELDELILRLKYQFGGDRYQLQGTAHFLNDRIVDQEASNYAYPREPEN